MNDAPFVHLRLHSEYSVVDGTLRIAEAVDAARRDGMPALALTDLDNLFGAVKFYQACRSQGVKPILGADVWMEPLAAATWAGSGDKAPSRLLLLVQDRRGYLNLCELLARAWVGNTGRGLAQLKWEWLEEQGGGLIALAGGDQGAVGTALLAGDGERARLVARRLAACFPGRFYIELQRAGLPQHEAHVRAAVPLAAELGLPVVATHPVQFLGRDDFEAHEARVCIAEGETLANPRRVRRFSPEQHFRPQADMRALFADVPSALANSSRIAMRCNLSLVLGKPQLPDFPTPGGIPLADHLRQVAVAGLEARLERLYPEPARRAAERPRYAERLDYELATIVQMGFAGYFLIVSDFIVWAKASGCPVGPGRGSGAGSLVAYALSITDLDPLAYQLLFERFLNPERVSMPDFDIDFCQANRDRVIDYVKARYGRDAVSQIATFGTMAAKAALRDVGRVLGMAYGHVDSIAKLIPAPPGRTVTLAPVPAGHDPDRDTTIYARREAPELNQREAAEEEVRELLALATRVEGLVRNVGMHAGGVLIAPGRITDFCPLYQQPGSDSAVSQFDKDDVEAIGLVKFDFLGLATLTILELAREFIRTRRPGLADFDYERLPFDDPKVYRLFAQAQTEAVFQFESRGMQAMLREARPARLEDLIALNAMFRPGPMENIPSFCRRKNGQEEIEYPHPLLEPVLAETYGIFVYQEQVMQAAQILGGYSLGGADLLRRAMGKKKPEEMAKHRGTFREGAARQGIDGAKADEVFDLMEKFAGYGFNKSHAAAYSVLAYHTAWVKVHAPAEFYAANMTVEADDTDKLHVLLADARLQGVEFEAPDVNRGVARFEPVGDRRVRYGLAAVKGTGAGAIEAIVAAREGADGAGGGPFRSLFDFCLRVDRQRVNKRVVEALVKAGAFDALGAGRSQLLASVGLAFDWAETQAANALQVGLFDFGDEAHGSSTQEPALVQVPAWDLRERLGHEKAALGLHMSGHLFDAYRDEVRRFVRRPIAELTDSREPQLIAGIVGAVRFVPTARGRLCIFEVDDGSVALEVSIDEGSLGAQRALLQDEALVVLQGRAQPDRRGGALRFNVAAIWDLPAARARFGRYLAVDLADGVPPVADVLELWPARRVESEHGELRQGLAVRLRLQRRSASAEIDLGDGVRFWPCDEALGRWRAVARGGAATVMYE
ncbi:MAG: DNA polymerase III subunit alpha [Pseudomonadota bacterium]|jgi:DNA polymerase-3 subunit alpha|nr:DNA polymerase III subunit alpha [Rubrivivax sp.]MCA3258877.1 DNA polymerase III subunit alpha [Rubrivivax sp.]MCE2910607.1 DNA polymerase III subunit alpha [Rubrivivax sp.]